MIYPKRGSLYEYKGERCEIVSCSLNLAVIKLTDGTEEIVSYHEIKPWKE